MLTAILQKNFVRIVEKDYVRQKNGCRLAEEITSLFIHMAIRELKNSVTDQGTSIQPLSYLDKKSHHFKKSKVHVLISLKTRYIKQVPSKTAQMNILYMTWLVTYMNGYQMPQEHLRVDIMLTQRLMAQDAFTKQLHIRKGIGIIQQGFGVANL